MTLMLERHQGSCWALESIKGYPGGDGTEKRPIPHNILQRGLNDGTSSLPSGCM